MSDITKCKGTDCPIKEKCYRFTSKEHDLYQSWFFETPGTWTEILGSLKSDINPDSLCYKPEIIRIFECKMFWGEQSESILNKLKSIVNGKVS